MQGFILGVETSCDETAVAIVSHHPDPTQRIKSNIIFSQIEEHRPYGGVVPELAARSHLLAIESLIDQAFEKAFGNVPAALNAITAIAVTTGPGLVGGLLMGMTVAKALAMVWDKPLIAINHLEGHALTIRLTHDVAYPYLLLLVSGGHCQFIDVQGLGRYVILGGTLDDAPGEAFDKVAKMMGLSYPGGPVIEQMAQTGDPLRYALPRPLKQQQDCMLSFSGLKTAMRQHIINTPLDDAKKPHLAASFQHAVAQHLAEKLHYAIQKLPYVYKNCVVSGGVAANETIRKTLQQVAQKHGMTFLAPPLPLCTDNAAMIAWAAIERYEAGLYTSDLTVTPKSRWSLA